MAVRNGVRQTGGCCKLFEIIIWMMWRENNERIKKNLGQLIFGVQFWMFSIERIRFHYLTTNVKFKCFLCWLLFEIQCDFKLPRFQIHTPTTEQISTLQHSNSQKLVMNWCGFGNQLINRNAFNSLGASGINYLLEIVF